uniref:Potassium channel domain-containing protein n=1 Tax=Pristionchus pacificus TaxID=54126 RepID=A0A8R1UC70_PRIPA
MERVRHCRGMKDGLAKPRSRKGRLLDKIYNIVTLGGRIPCVVLIVYTIAGGLIFRHLEMGEDVVRRRQYAEASEFAVNQMLDRMLEVKCHDQILKKNRQEQIRHAKDAIYWFLDHLNLTEVIASRSEESPWTILGSMFYAGQLYTTIGYGIPTTQTREGQMVSIFYILFGIPIFLVALKQVGQSLSMQLKKAYRKLRRKRKSKNKDGKDAEKNSEDSMNEEEKEKRRAANKLATMLTQIPIAFGLLLAWILISACLLTCWETQWGLTTSIYFYFVSISTVGLGDIIPTNNEMLVVNFILILIGLAMLSMCLNLLQTLIENLWSLLIREYICEMEVMAHEGTEDGLGEEAPAVTFEMGILGKLMRLPAIEHRQHTMMGVAKHWMAERVATEVIGRQLESDPDSDSDGEEKEEELAEEYRDEVAELRVEDSMKLHMATATTAIQHGGSDRSSHSIRSRASQSSTRLLRDSRVMHNKALFNRIQTMERLRPHRNDFKSMVFSKFLASDQLQKMVDHNEHHRMRVSTAVQTDGGGGMDTANGGSGCRRPRPGSMISTASSNGSFVMDEERYLLLGYEDGKIGNYAQDDESPVHVILQQYLDDMRERENGGRKMSKGRLLSKSSRPSSIAENRLGEEAAGSEEGRDEEEASVSSVFSSPTHGVASPMEASASNEEAMGEVPSEEDITRGVVTPASPMMSSTAGLLDSGYGKEGESSMSEAVPIVQSTIPEEDYRTTVDEPPHSPVRIQWRNTLDDGPSPRI